MFAQSHVKSVCFRPQFKHECTKAGGGAFCRATRGWRGRPRWGWKQSTICDKSETSGHTLHFGSHWRHVKQFQDSLRIQQKTQDVLLFFCFQNLVYTQSWIYVPLTGAKNTNRCKHIINKTWIQRWAPNRKSLFFLVCLFFYMFRIVFCFAHFFVLFNLRLALICLESCCVWLLSFALFGFCWALICFQSCFVSLISFVLLSFCWALICWDVGSQESAEWCQHDGRVLRNTFFQ